jgi:D-alanyl-lipoteichoic acid acyltransferase DltB (MBOAT superfamily)
MLFNSLDYLLFLPTVFLFYWFVFRSLKWQNLLVVVVSYIFYGWWDKTFLLLIAFTTFCSYLSGVGIERVRNVKESKLRGVKWDWWISAANILINLLILAVYKYFNFFAENFANACEVLGYHPGRVTLQLVLPVGISFYTFQALSYTIDVYRRKLEPTHDIVAFFAFISFFPQLVAGPIERATNLLPQFLKKREFEYGIAVDGLRQILWGLFKKVVVADQCAVAVEQIWENYSDESGFTLLLGAFFFTIQIYGDFSGYSDIAIGTAKLFGVSLMRNFAFPYFSRDIAEFWRRWHISLTTWFRDYIYIPLGGSRCAKWKVMRNTMVIFLVSGFWHGANWTFVIWGAYHALLFFPLLLLGMNRKYTNIVAVDRYLPNLTEAFQMLFTFFLAMIGWVIFRSENMNQCADYFAHMCSSSLFQVSIEYGKRAVMMIVLMFVVEWLNRDKQHGLQFDYKGIFSKSSLRWGIYLVLILIIILFRGSQSDFIYFQF